MRSVLRKEKSARRGALKSRDKEGREAASSNGKTHCTSKKLSGASGEDLVKLEALKARLSELEARAGQRQ